MKVMVTQYGLSKKAGGWDAPDQEAGSQTDQRIGNHDNPLIENLSCAVTDSVKKTLGLKPGDKIKLVWPNGQGLIVQYDDRAPEIDDRIDLWKPKSFDKTINAWGDFAEATKL